MTDVIGPGVVGSPFTAYATGYEAGLVGSLTVTIETSEGDVVLAPTTDDIIEIDAGGDFSTYRYTGTYPPLGSYVLIWEDPDGIQAAEVLISGSEPVASSDAIYPGPCVPWTTAEDVADCVGVTLGSDNAVLLDASALAASEILFAKSGRMFGGECAQNDTRPCSTRNLCGVQILSRGHVVTWDGSRWRGAEAIGGVCGCRPLSRVKLAGYPVVSISTVLIDGAVVDPSEYRLDENRYLTRMADADGDQQFWPSCQRLDLPTTEEGTFAVSYVAGALPPTSGELAARQLAGEIYRSCPGTADGGECALPAGATRVTRQGLTVEMGLVAQFLEDGKTGLGLVDSFIASHGMKGPAPRRSTVWSPDLARFARPAGSGAGS